MAEQPDGQPERTEPDRTEPGHTDPDPAEPNDTDQDPAGPDDTGPDDTEPNPAAASAGDENPRGLLFTSDRQALRRADTIRVHATDGAGVIDAILTTLAGDQPRIYTATEQRLFPEPDGHQRRRRIAVAADIAGFDTDRRWHDHQLPGATATAVIDGAQLHEVWRSVAAFLRVGDIVRLRWHTNTNTGTGTDRLTCAGLHRDELLIEVRRGKRTSTFLLHVAVGPSSRRMVTAPAHR
ncbi:hypothetical protein [Virgisporangium aurantiacum]|uniref:Uncharacterized protein n=1 Tax=Virgisporangium aurantiacum TaxID=175570 RepID=A0A8J3ZII6_9ACTN|nr:hypothetical protein [Virgisporangium aurantiacum]GIJ62033.1 hypothetical protein Vau01_095490 [Virgisporangium aurantiacum]